MSHHDLQKPLQPVPTVLDDIVTKPVGEHLARQGRDGDARGLALEDVAEVFEVAVAAADDRVAEFEGRDVGSCVDLVGGIHVAWVGAVGLRVLDLEGGSVRGRMGCGCEMGDG